MSLRSNFPSTQLLQRILHFTFWILIWPDSENHGDTDYAVSMTWVTDGELAWFQCQNDYYVKWTIATNKDFIMADVADFNGDGWVDIAAVGLGNSDNTVEFTSTKALCFLMKAS